MADQPRDDGDPAFSRPQAQTSEGWRPGHPGMSLRDYFAGQALAGFIAAEDSSPAVFNRAPDMARTVALAAYLLAGAMLQARKA